MDAFEYRWILTAVASFITVGSAAASEEVYRKTAASSALIYKVNGPDSGSGTGFLFDVEERLLLTARHVVEKSTGGLVDFCYVVFAQSKDGEIITELAHYRKDFQSKALKGKVVYDSVPLDLAVVQVDKLPEGMRPLPLAATKARPGQTVHVVGNSSERFGGAFNYCQGYVRNVFRWEVLGATIVSTHVPTNKGDSGGPLVNNLGEVVGFASMSTLGAGAAKDSPFHDVQVTNFCICVSEIRVALTAMRSRHLAKRDDGPRSVTFEGRARQNIHMIQLERDVLYRVLVKADKFTPELRVENVLVASTANAPPLLALGGSTEYFYTATESKAYRFQVSHVPGRDLGQGPLAYTVTVDQVVFEKETSVKVPEVKRTEHVHKLEAGKFYKMTVRGKGFEPDLTLFEGNTVVARRFNNGIRHNAGAAQNFFETVGLAASEFETTLTYLAPRTSEHRLLIAVSQFSPARTGPLDYTLAVSELKIDLTAEGKLSAKDPLYPQAGPFKVHPLKLEAGKTYQVELTTGSFDSKLALEDGAGKLLVNGTDAESFGSRLTFRPTQTGTYRVIVTSHDPLATGNYTLMLVEVPDVFPAPAKKAK